MLKLRNQQCHTTLQTSRKKYLLVFHRETLPEGDNLQSEINSAYLLDMIFCFFEKIKS